jgi:Catalase
MWVMCLIGDSDGSLRRNYPLAIEGQTDACDAASRRCLGSSAASVFRSGEYAIHIRRLHHARIPHAIGFGLLSTTALAAPTPMTQDSGAPIGDNENSKTAGPDGPVLLEDFHLIEKLARFDRE